MHKLTILRAAGLALVLASAGAMGVAVTRPATLSITEASALLGISRNYGFFLASRGEFPGARRLGNRWIVSRRVLLEFLDGAVRDAPSDKVT